MDLGELTIEEQKEIMDAKKPKRRQNFSEKEVARLVMEVEVSIDTIQSKLSSSVSIASKNQVWQKITDRINSVCYGCIRTKEEVRRKWHDLVSTVRKKESARQRLVNQTGGGLPPTPLTDIEEKILGLIPPVMVEGIEGGMESKVPGINSSLVGETATLHAQVPSCSINNEQESAACEGLLPNLTQMEQVEPVAGSLEATTLDATSFLSASQPKKRRNSNQTAKGIYDNSKDQFLLIESQKLELERRKVELMERAVVAQERMLAIQTERNNILAQINLEPLDSPLSHVIKFM